ncbi:MAG: aminotransferase class I/II-fold pyridoxal phosphate-dependent enzyme, partial [Proteobacteria bacterium]|nr:aminotransferase class I/II-fold pyridoxal phosphate-dependent enzyme [Pseudomonadota bacterium]
MLIGHGGNIYDLAQRLDCDPFEIIDMSSNVNPLPPMPGLMNFLKKNIHTITALPEADAQSAAQAFALRYSLDSDQVIAGNGSTQFIFAIPQALKTRRALILGPTYADYADACNMHAVPYDYFTASESLDFQPDIAAVSRQVKAYDTVFICNPNNPTGALIPKADLLRLARSCPNTYFIVDESYLPFVKAADQLSMLGCGLDNVLVLNSMSKIFRIPGLRIGFLISSHRV